MPVANALRVELGKKKLKSASVKLKAFRQSEIRTSGSLKRCRNINRKVAETKIKKKTKVTTFLAVARVVVRV